MFVSVMKEQYVPLESTWDWKRECK